MFFAERVASLTYARVASLTELELYTRSRARHARVRLSSTRRVLRWARGTLALRRRRCALPRAALRRVGDAAAQIGHEACGERERSGARAQVRLVGPLLRRLAQAAVRAAVHVSHLVALFVRFVDDVTWAAVDAATLLRRRSVALRRRRLVGSTRRTTMLTQQLASHVRCCARGA